MLNSKLAYHTFALPSGADSLLDTYQHGAEKAIFVGNGFMAAAHPLKPHQDVAYGFVSPGDCKVDMFAADSEFEPLMPTIALVRRDAWAVPASVVRAEIRAAQRDWMFQNQSKRIPKDVKSAIKERVIAACRSKSIPTMKVVPVVFDFTDTSTHLLRVFTSSKRLAIDIAEFIGNVFGVQPAHVTFAHLCADVARRHTRLASTASSLTTAAAAAGGHNSLHSLCLDSATESMWADVSRAFPWWLLHRSRAQNLPFNLLPSMAPAAEVYVMEVDSAQMVTPDVTWTAKGKVGAMETVNLLSCTAANVVDTRFQAQTVTASGEIHERGYRVRISAADGVVRMQEYPKLRPTKEDKDDDFRNYSNDLYGGLRQFEHLLASALVSFMQDYSRPQVWESVMRLESDVVQ